MNNKDIYHYSKKNLKKTDENFNLNIRAIHCIHITFISNCPTAIFRMMIGGRKYGVWYCRPIIGPLQQRLNYKISTQSFQKSQLWATNGSEYNILVKTIQREVQILSTVIKQICLNKKAEVTETQLPHQTGNRTLQGIQYKWLFSFVICMYAAVQFPNYIQ